MKTNSKALVNGTIPATLGYQLAQCDDRDKRNEKVRLFRKKATTAVGVASELSLQEKHEVLAMIEAADRQSLDVNAIQEREHAVVRGEYGALHGTLLIKATGAHTKPAFAAAHKSDERITKLLEGVIKSLKQ